MIGVAASSQTLTYLNHSPAWGNAPYEVYQCDSTGIAPGASGAGAAWNFTTNGLNSLRTYSTSNAVAGSSYPNANVSVSSSASNVSYYFSNTTILKYYGGDISVNSFDVNVKYNSPAIIAIYPMSLSTTTTSATSGTVNITSPFAQSGTFTGNCIATADGTGTLTLPARTFTNVIRTVTSQTLNATLGFITALVNLENYDYYCTTASKAPIFSIQTSTIAATGFPTSTQTIVTVLKDYVDVSVKENKAQMIDLSVFPNPATSVINFSTVSMVASKVVVSDITGKIVATEQLEMGKTKMNTSHLNAGVYLYTVLDKNNQTLTTGKFNVTR